MTGHGRFSEGRPWSDSIEFKRQAAQEFLGGETLYGLAERHDLSHNLLRIRVAKYKAGVFDDDAQAAALMQQYEAKIASLELNFSRELKKRVAPTRAASPTGYRIGRIG